MYPSSFPYFAANSPCVGIASLERNILSKSTSRKDLVCNSSTIWAIKKDLSKVWSILRVIKDEIPNISYLDDNEKALAFSDFGVIEKAWFKYDQVLEKHL